MFPIPVPTEYLEKYPKFAELLQKLNKKLNRDGARQATQIKLEAAEHKVRVARESWLLKKVIHHEIQELLADLEIRGQSNELSVDEKQLRDVLVKAVSFSELEEHLVFYSNPSNTHTLFGLTKEDLERHNPVKQLMSGLQQAIVPMIEERLKKKCEKLYNFYVTTEDESSLSDGLQLAKAQSLPGVVEDKLKDCLSEREALSQLKERGEKQLWLYYQSLLDSLALMERMIQDFMLASQGAKDEVNFKCLRVRCEALYLKVRVTQLNIKCSLYTTQSVQALKKIKSHLDSKTKQTERDLLGTSKSLEAYHAIDSGFTALVEEFTLIQQEINNKKWCLEKVANLEPEGQGAK